MKAPIKLKLPITKEQLMEVQKKLDAGQYASATEALRAHRIALERYDKRLTNKK